MVIKSVKIKNEQGLHMRPAGIFAKAMSQFSSEIKIIHNGNKLNGKSIMNIIGGCIKYGDEIEIQCNGSDEEEALKTAIELIVSGFDE